MAGTLVRGRLSGLGLSVAFLFTAVILRALPGAEVVEPAGSIQIPHGTTGCQVGKWIESPYAFDAGAPGGVTARFEGLNLFDVRFADPAGAPFEVLAGFASTSMGSGFEPPDNSVWISIGHNGCGSGTTSAPCYVIREWFNDPLGPTELLIPANGPWNQEVKGGLITGTDPGYDTFDLVLELRPIDADRYNLVVRVLRYKASEAANKLRSGILETLLPTPAPIGTPRIDLRRVHAFVGLRYSQCSGGIPQDSALAWSAVRISGDVPVPELRLEVPGVLGPAEPVTARLLLTAAQDRISALGARLSYDPVVMSLAGPDLIVRGAGLPATWDFVFKDQPAPGCADLVVTDLTPTAATIRGPVAGLEVGRLALTRIGLGCLTADFGFNEDPPAPGAPSAAFPMNHYITWNDPILHKVEIVKASTQGTNGPVMTDHAFIRGNVNNRKAHRLDLSDVVDLAAMLFSGFPAVPCAAALDVNNDGGTNITDLITLLHGIFNAGEIAIGPPNAASPGLGIPGVAAPDGGTIPSVLGCIRGETCP